jgi:hypothetical protein
VLALGGQLRVSETRVLGWDMTAALAMARALGVPETAAAEILPEIEPVMVRKTNEQIAAGARGNGD